MKKRKYQVALKGQIFTRTSHREYATAGGYFHKATGELFGFRLAFAGRGKTPNPARPSEKPMSKFPRLPLLKDYELCIAPVEVV